MVIMVKKVMQAKQETKAPQYVYVCLYFSLLNRPYKKGAWHNRFQIFNSVYKKVGVNSLTYFFSLNALKETLATLLFYH